ncbi:MAG TPA: hypothetical protein VFD83_04435, partial [Candidatus Polarisedimenticolia bacterium]|nr:hypothetical protein [Candidatus Polarisedimenticolia bacterium]
VTLGAVAGGFKLEASAFRGREPDQNRFDIESPTLDSHSFRASWNPTPEWSLQISRGRLTSPEQLEPEVDVDRTTASAILAQDWEGGHAELMVAWGQNRKRHGNATEAITTELALELLGRHTLFTRLERVEKDELFEETSPFADRTFPVYKSGLGYRFDFRKGAPRIGLGATVSEIWVPGTIRDAYGDDTRAVLLFTRVAL